MFLRPEKILSAFGVEPGWHIADLGSGTGVYTLHLSDLVGGAGRVYAIDIQSELLRHVQELAERNRRKNIYVMRGDLESIDGLYLRNELLDAGIAANIFFQLEEKGKFIAEVRRTLKPRARLLLVDWTDSFNHMGPHPEMVVPPEKAEKMFVNNGFEYIRSLPAGDHHYALVFRKI